MPSPTSPESAPSPSKSRDTLTGISIGDPVLFLTLADIHAEFAPFGWSLRQFRAFIKGLGVPILTAPNRIELVNYRALQYALWAFTSIGARSMNQTTPKLRFATRPTAADISRIISPEGWRRFIAEILYARINASAPSSTPPRVQFQQAIKTMSSLIADSQRRAYTASEARLASLLVEHLTPPDSPPLTDLNVDDDLPPDLNIPDTL